MTSKNRMSERTVGPLTPCTLDFASGSSQRCIIKKRIMGPEDSHVALTVRAKEKTVGHGRKYLAGPDPPASPVELVDLQASFTRLQ